MRIVKGNKIYESFFDEVDDEEIVSSEM